MDVKTLCLGVLSLGDATGYEIRKQFVEGPFSHFYDAGYGSIYPALGRLLSEGLVSVQEMFQDGRPDKKIYSLTDQGLAVFKTALTEPPVRDKIRSEHVARLFFAEHVDDAVLASIYDSYLNEIREMSGQIRAAKAADTPISQRFTMGLGLAFYDVAEKYLEDNRDEFLKSMSDEHAASEGNELKIEVGNDD